VSRRHGSQSRGTRLRRLILLTISVLLFAAAAAPLRADDVGAYLERLGLRRLLAVHLEEQLESARGEARDAIVRQLADLYAELLLKVQDPDERALLEQRGRTLVSSLPDQDAGALRLALLRGSYRTAKQIAENHRLRLSSPAEIERAQALLTDIIPRFNQLMGFLDGGIELLERQLARAGGADSAALFTRIEEARALRDECAFYYAWAMYYQSWLNQRRDNALIAIRAFSELLDVDAYNPDLNEVSVDLRSLEPIARSILGVALCKSLTSTSASASNWIDLLEHENTYKPLREEAPIWRIVIWLEHDEFDRARDELARCIDSQREVPAPWLRLIAAQALERGGRDRNATALIRYAVTELASREALDQVLDLAKRYGTDALGEQGFALRYVRGVMTYSEARGIHGGDGPATDSSIVETFGRAAADLEAALAEPDAGNYTDASAACRRLIGYCRYFQGRYLEARNAFTQAAEALRHDADAAEAMWMAIVSLDKVVEARGSEALAAELDDLMSRFIRRFPSSEYAPKVMLKQALAVTGASEEAVQTLLDIPENSEVYLVARRRAAQVLYQLFRDARGERREGYARRFIDIALPVNTQDMARLGAPGAPPADELVTRCRMLLEVALGEGVARVAAARQAFAWLDELAAAHDADLAQWRDELDYRRVQERLLGGDIAEARALADALWDRAEDSIWSRLASRALFNFAHRQWREAATPAEVDRELLRLIDRYGLRILLETAGDADALKDPAVLSYHATVAEAERLLWEQTHDEQRGRAALSLFEKLLEARPSNARFLQSAAALSQALGKPEQALDCCRRLLAGSEVRSELWFEAKFRQIDILIGLRQFDRAREVLDQHTLLNPDYGPDPWGARLKGLQRKLVDAEAAAGKAGDAAEDGP